MNNKLHEYLKKAEEEISLTHEEREKMRGVLHAYMAMKPIRTLATQSRASTFSWFFTLRPVAAVLVGALFVSSAGISYAAEGALPGDILYTVKTHVNEPVKGALALSASAKTAWAMSVAGERIKEATMLAAEGRLNSEHQQELQANFESHARKVSENISAQASTSPEKSAETAVRFEAQLSEYERVLAHVGGEGGVEASALVASIHAEREHIASVRKQSDLIIEERAHARELSADMKTNSSKGKAQENRKSGRERSETRRAESTQRESMQNPATTTNQPLIHDAENATASLSASSSQSSSEKMGEGAEIKIKSDGDVEIKNPIPPQPIVPVFVPAPVLP